MDAVSSEQIRYFRLHTHHLDTWYAKADVERIAGACGLQNSPPGAWEVALHNRVADCTQDDMRQMLEEERTLLQAWSFRGAPVVFPAAESGAFLTALVSTRGEPRIYTRGIQLALDYLRMPFEELLQLLTEVMPKLDGQVIRSKAVLDQTLAAGVLPLLPQDRRSLWAKPSMYGNPERQTVGGAVVSFLLRPCAFMGLVVFGKREGISPTFTSYKSWTGHSLESEGISEQRLVRKYLHGYGPASSRGFMGWLGCSPAQAERMWHTVTDHIEPVTLNGKVLYVLTDDKERLLSPPQPKRRLHLLGGHDPYLSLQDREVILDNRVRQKHIWRTVSNPGAVLWRGCVVGTWKSRKRGKRIRVSVALWDDGNVSRAGIQDLVDRYAAFQELTLDSVTFLT
ncbi:MAG TPA: winged helix DNA-binding domain-containing protein [Chloroflexi bacterium]|jgi:hypothetical protein|nr:winged helix DNA-binding domain-containing protein [Chloroflexota bacterium]